MKTTGFVSASRLQEIHRTELLWVDLDISSVTPKVTFLVLSHAGNTCSWKAGSGMCCITERLFREENE